VSTNDGGDSGPASSTVPSNGRSSLYFVYWLKIRNTSAKEITGMTWEYIFIDPGSNKEIAAHRFFSYEKVATNKSFALRGKSALPPSKVVSVQGLEKDRRSPYFERVEIKCVMYADGSFWKHPSAKPRDCAHLKLGKILIGG
jgi:hypothetical protein